MPSRSGFPFAKIVTILASIFGVALGMCGLNFVLLTGMSNAGNGPGKLIQAVGPVLGVLGFIELAAMVITGPLLLIAVIGWVISEAFGSRGGSEPQKLFDETRSKSERDQD